MSWFHAYEAARGDYGDPRIHWGGIYGGARVEEVARRANMCPHCGCSHDLCAELGCTDGDYLARWAESAARLHADLDATAARQFRLRDLWHHVVRERRTR